MPQDSDSETKIIAIIIIILGRYIMRNFVIMQAIEYC
jgi:hypothetical protein